MCIQFTIRTETEPLPVWSFQTLEAREAQLVIKAVVSSSDLLKRLEEEMKIKTYVVSEKLPKELEHLRHKVQYLQKVEAEPAMGRADVQELEDKVRQRIAYLTVPQLHRDVRS